MGNDNLWYTVSQDDTTGRHTVRWETYTSFNMPKEILFGNLVSPTNPTATVAGRTLSFVYGPEHQRVRQDVKLTTNAPTHMEAGTTWYYNGAYSQGLSYEKTVLANGTTEHKHFVNAGGVTFALYVKREGVLNGKPATSISYFHHDHLGSIAAVSNETGQVVERMAYDPWGKRRFPNGANDKLDALYGVATDRGYTMHEHLDEMGIIHMNGRVFDPLIGRFMSADPHIQSPLKLQNFNRYGYVLNNPMRFIDPSGYFYGDTRDYDSDGNTTYNGNSYTDGGNSFSDSESIGTLSTVTVTATRDYSYDHQSDSGSDWSSYQVAGLVFVPPPARLPHFPVLVPRPFDPRLERPVVAPVTVLQMPRPANVLPSVAVLEHLYGVVNKGLEAVLSVGREKDVPNRAEPNSIIDGNHRTREYDSDGKPARDYDNPHQGYPSPHVHEWEDGRREHPGRDYSPWPR